MKPITTKRLKLCIDAYLLERLEVDNEPKKVFSWHWDQDRQCYVKVYRDISFSEWKERMIYQDEYLNYVIERSLDEMPYYPDAVSIIKQIRDNIKEN